MQRPRKSGAFVFLGVWSKNSNALIHNTEIVRRGPGRVERWRVDLIEGPVSSARHIARSVRISRTTRSCTLHIQGYETYGMGTAVGDGRYETRYWLNRPNVS